MGRQRISNLSFGNCANNLLNLESISKLNSQRQKVETPLVSDKPSTLKAPLDFLLLQRCCTSQGNFMIVFYATAADTNCANNVSTFVL